MGAIMQHSTAGQKHGTAWLCRHHGIACLKADVSDLVMSQMIDTNDGAGASVAQGWITTS